MPEPQIVKLPQYDKGLYRASVGEGIVAVVADNILRGEQSIQPIELTDITSSIPMRHRITTSRNVETPESGKPAERRESVRVSPAASITPTFETGSFYPVHAFMASRDSIIHEERGISFEKSADYEYWVQACGRLVIPNVITLPNAVVQIRKYPEEGGYILYNSV